MVRGRDERHYLRAGRVGVVVTGAVLCAFASFCVFWQRAHDDAGGGGLLGFALSVMVFAYAGMAAVFVTALFTRRGAARASSPPWRPASSWSRSCSRT